MRYLVWSVDRTFEAWDEEFEGIGSGLRWERGHVNFVCFVVIKKVFSYYFEYYATALPIFNFAGNVQ